MAVPNPSDGYQYEVSREVDAPVATVWKVWTQPEHYQSWAHAAPGSVAMDVRPGGAWQATMVTPDGGQVPLTGSYREVTPVSRLVIAMNIPGRDPAVMEVDFTDLGDRTRIVLTQTCDTAEERDGARAGSEMLLRGCADYLSTV